MGRLKPQTFYLGAGILTCPNGEEFKVRSFTITQGDPIELVQGGDVIRQEPSREPVRITFEEVTDGKDQQTDDVHGHGEGGGEEINVLPPERRRDSDQGQ